MLRLRFLYSLWIGSFCAQSLSAVTIFVDFGSSYTGLPANYAAAAPTAGTWNAITSLGATALVDVSGGVTSSSITVTADTITGDGGTPTSDTEILLNDNFYTQDGGWSVEINSLPAGPYEIYVYAPSNGVVDTGAFSIEGTGAANLTGNDDPASLVDGVSWSMTQIILADGTLNVDFAGGTGYFGLSGLQVVATPIPEPKSPAILLGAAAGMIALRRRWVR